MRACRHGPQSAAAKPSPVSSLTHLACWARMAVELPEVLVRDAAAWEQWLDGHHEGSPGAWLVLAKKGVTRPTSLTYDQALVEAACYGWIDGQLSRRDETTYRQRFTPRRPRSAWSANNVALAERLISEGRMRPAGLAAVDRAKADGRWEAAYAGSAAMEVPPDLAEALAADPAALAGVRTPQPLEPLRRAVPGFDRHQPPRPGTPGPTLRVHALAR